MNIWINKLAGSSEKVIVCGALSLPFLSLPVSYKFRVVHSWPRLNSDTTQSHSRANVKSRDRGREIHGEKAASPKLKRSLDQSG